jgi:hypothetical protein
MNMNGVDSSEMPTPTLHIPISVNTNSENSDGMVMGDIWWQWRMTKRRVGGRLNFSYAIAIYTRLPYFIIS